VTGISQRNSAMSGIGAILRAADPAEKIEIYRQVGLKAHVQAWPPRNLRRGESKWIMY
jgi:hypothetical protein